MVRLQSARNLEPNANDWANALSSSVVTLSRTCTTPDEIGSVTAQIYRRHRHTRNPTQVSDTIRHLPIGVYQSEPEANARGSDCAAFVACSTTEAVRPTSKTERTMRRVVSDLLTRRTDEGRPARCNQPDDRRSTTVARLALTLVHFVMSLE